jgi:UDP-N-acetylglucosamine--N-acetylmuramyl-(pentapeptide) pyrophosphoryl-undecaprenol N-acetylglucosamine transferase
VFFSVHPNNFLHLEYTVVQSSLIVAFVLLFVLLVGLIVLASRRWRRLAASEPRVILTGGGTGGHVNPALAIAEGIKNRDPNTQFLYVGVRGKAEAIIVRRVGYPLVFVSSEGFPGLRPSFRTLRFLCRLSLGVVQSLFILFRFAPRWVVATGGYVSAPIIIATLILQALRLSPTKIFLHEQNSIPGQLNAFLGRWVDRVLLTFPQTLSFFKKNGVVVGYPIRGSIALKPREEALKDLSFTLPPGRQVVFAFGGSQGARTINRALVDALRHLLPHRDRLFIIHGMGLNQAGGYDAAADTSARLEASFEPEERALLDTFYYRQDYFHNIGNVYSISDLIVCRSGAGSLNEISQLGKPAILIPKANLPGDHQVMNARAMKHGGGAEILFEDTIVEQGEVLEKLEGEVLAEKILRLLNHPQRLNEMAALSRQFLRRNAVERILSELYQDDSYNNGTGYRSIPFKPLLTNHRLLQVLQRAHQSDPLGYNPASAVGDEDDLTYYQHRAAGLLSHEPWQDRNLGVKLIGLTLYREKIPTLLHMLSDTTPTSRIKQWFGGDFKQVGFIRRNIVQALQILNQMDPEVERHLLRAMEDPYFEVCSQACIAAAHFGPQLVGKENWLQAVIQRLEDPCFEVSVEAAKALGEIGVDHRSLDVLLQLKESHYWQVRDAALKGIKHLLERRVIAPSPELLMQIASFILTATDFRPHFSIKETYQTLQKLCRERESENVVYAAPEILPETALRKRMS